MRPRTLASWLPAVAVALALTVLAAACGSGAATIGPFTGQSITVRAVGVAFQPDEISLPQGQPLRIVLDNQDVGVPHDIRVFQGDQELGKSSTITGPGQTEVRFGPLAPGRYQFACEVHPSMVGTLVITP